MFDPVAAPSFALVDAVPVLFGSWVGFSGSRRWPSSPGSVASVSSVVSAVALSGYGVAVGCASGVDALVSAFADTVLPSPPVARFSVADGPWGSGRGAYAARSAALVRSVAVSAASDAPGAFVVFVSSLCPPAVRPVFGRSASFSASAAFCGAGSGSWASASLAVSLGLPVFVFPALGSLGMLPDFWPGYWRPIPDGAPWAGSGRLFAPDSFAVHPPLPGF